MPDTLPQRRMLPILLLFGTLFAVTLPGEPFRLYHLAGFALVLGGVVLISRR
jgi:drug/metabolite transporter (DMT)-like permease